MPRIVLMVVCGDLCGVFLLDCLISVGSNALCLSVC